jgi:hypothetical protein
MMCEMMCVDTRMDEMNCGACGTVCPDGQICRNSACGCRPNETLCDGACVNKRTDTANCGMCGNACATEETCTAGSCGPAR